VCRPQGLHTAFLCNCNQYVKDSLHIEISTFFSHKICTEKLKNHSGNSNIQAGTLRMSAFFVSAEFVGRGCRDAPKETDYYEKKDHNADADNGSSAEPDAGCDICSIGTA
jgi:hypothetical protein